MNKNITKRKYTKVITAFAILHSAEKQVIAILLGLIIATSLLYVYFLGSAVLYAVERKDVQHTLAQKNSSLADLEVGYLQKKSVLTSEFAQLKGYTIVSSKRFVERSRYLGQANIR